MPVIEWHPSPNYSSRGGRKIIAIVDHVTAGSYPGCLNWLCNPASQSSAHYLVTKTGRILQLVKEGDTAWHAGIRNKPSWALYDGTNPNTYTLGIEHEGQPGDVMPEAQYQATLWLHKDLTQKYGIPIDADHIIGHYRIDSVNRPNCPGVGFPWDRLFKDLKGGRDVLKTAVLLYTKEDFWAGYDVAVKHGNCAIFVRPPDLSVPAEARAAEKLIVVGGATTNHPNEVLLSGNDKYQTAAAVAKYLG
ncbi:N-acetylmuramoyl-L-alanine amidase [Desulfosporosinus youngiae]|uniref:N-acetylmuramoyl-L-alanine amidase n=1 Tax=Desulfosporosinus youngiae DSM 17734 TaxID=768710 RepID=H5XZS3_9FIRM|nr:N-acetylmuramoyl-L-alanine amidase [Desulfosporosinus youngiae]EHQ92119.1 negative regulator of beta-lactamase expression [Desulfosporosinus youngiae DSM 17734]